MTSSSHVNKPTRQKFLTDFQAGILERPRSGTVFTFNPLTVLGTLEPSNVYFKFLFFWFSLKRFSQITALAMFILSFLEHLLHHIFDNLCSFGKEWYFKLLLIVGEHPKTAQVRTFPIVTDIIGASHFPYIYIMLQPFIKFRQTNMWYFWF